jgi:hypothetical protein
VRARSIDEIASAARSTARIELLRRLSENSSSQTAVGRAHCIIVLVGDRSKDHKSCFHDFSLQQVRACIKELFFFFSSFCRSVNQSKSSGSRTGRNSKSDDE